MSIGICSTGIISLDSGIELVDADFGTLRNDEDERCRKRSRIEEPSDSQPEELDNRLDKVFESKFLKLYVRF